MAFTAALRRIGPQLGNNYRGVNVSSRISYSLSSILCGEGTTIKPGGWSVPEEPFDPYCFYKENLQHHVAKCYSDLNIEDPSNTCRGHLLFISELVSLAVRYPSAFQDELWEEFKANRIFVPDPSILPILECPIPNQFSILKNPIQVIPFDLPSPGSVIFYCDGCPNRKSGDSGGGGGIVTSSSEEVRVYGVRVSHGTPSQTEAKVILAAVRLAVAMGIECATFVTDCQDVVDGINGRRYIRDDDEEAVFRELRFWLAKLKERFCVYMPREGVAFSDSIGRDIRKHVEWYGDFPEAFDVAFEIAIENLSEKNKKLLSKFIRRIPAIRIQPFTATELKNKKGLFEKRRWCPQQP